MVPYHRVADLTVENRIYRHRVIAHLEWLPLRVNDAKKDRMRALTKQLRRADPLAVSAPSFHLPGVAVWRIFIISMTVVRALAVEHQSFRATFARIERTLPAVGRLAQVRRLAREVEALLDLHARAEEDLVLLTLDHLPKRQAWCRAFYRQHQEIDSSLGEALLAKELVSAKRFLRKAFRHSRRHFAYEERMVFPLWEKWIDRDLLNKLGRIWRHRRDGTAA